MSVEAPDDATLIDPEEARALLPTDITTQAELNAWEQDNVADGERWAFARRRNHVLTESFLKRLHKRMFGDTWKWAGQWRRTEKNIGIAPERVPDAVRQLLLDFLGAR